VPSRDLLAAWPELPVLQKRRLLGAFFDRVNILAAHPHLVSELRGDIEATLNALPQFVTEIDGLDIHFIHVRSEHEGALPLIVNHGWPGSSRA
jgi:hypothetical protein